MGDCSPTDPVPFFSFLIRNTNPVMETGRVGPAHGLCDLLQGLMEGEKAIQFNASKQEQILERVFLYAMCWSVGGMLEQEDRAKFDQWLRQRDDRQARSEEHTSELQSLMRISYAVFC